MFGDNRATPRPKRPRSINASFPSPQRDSQNNSLRVFWRVLHPRGFVSEIGGSDARVHSLWRAPHAGFHVETPSRSSSGFAPALVRSHAAAMVLRPKIVSEIGQRALDAPVTPIPVLLGIRITSASTSLGMGGPRGAVVFSWRSASDARPTASAV